MPVAVNLDKPHLWKVDIAQSVDLFNHWFLNFAPKAYRDTRVRTTKSVELALQHTAYLRSVNADVLRKHPSVLPTLRMATAPPLARDRLIGLANVPPSLVKNLEEDNRLPPRMDDATLAEALDRIAATITRLADRDIFPWLDGDRKPTEQEAYRAATIVADRLCGAVANPIIRNAQEQRQLAAIEAWLKRRGYSPVPSGEGTRFDRMPKGTYAFHMNVVVTQETVNGEKTTNIPIDAVVMPKEASEGEYPLLIEAKSAGDYTNTNKRRKEEARKVSQLRQTYGKDKVRFVLFLCGYFDTGYLGYVAAEGIDWVWEHRIDDLEGFGI